MWRRRIRRIAKRKFCFLLYAAIWSFIFCSINYILLNTSSISVKVEMNMYLVEFKIGVRGNFEPSKTDNEAKGPGENGEPVNPDGYDDEIRNGTQEYGINTFVSDMILLNRTIPDSRPLECVHWHYPTKLPKTTVCIVFHNEWLSTLLRTIHSVLNRSPAGILLEVLLVDDFSDKDHLKQKLHDYIKQLNGRVRIIHNVKREGLIQSKNICGQNAGGEVIVFLEAYTEVNTNWLPPLLAPIVEDTQTVTISITDYINPNTFSYHNQFGNDLIIGIFDWSLLYKDSELSVQENKGRNRISEPFKSPVHTGWTFAINSSWFNQLGWYDRKLQMWGSENFELSFKVWQCGGRILNVPCSRVGRVYHEDHFAWGKFNSAVNSMNMKRIAEVWMDEYKEYYYTREPLVRFKEAGDLTKQIEIRIKNKCKSFDWFMKNVAINVINQYPLPSPNVVWGEANNWISDKCIDTMSQPILGTLGVYACHHQGGTQMFRLNQKGQISNSESCIVAVDDRAQTIQCNITSDEGVWEYRNETNQIYNRDKESCLNIDGDKLNLAKCDSDSQFQKWMWTELRI